MVARSRGYPWAERSLRTTLLTVLILSVAGTYSFADPAPGNDGTYYANKANFRIPFQIDPAERRIRDVQLHVSEDQGKRWDHVATAKPNERFFSFTATHDGWYWFTVRTVDFEDHGYPATLSGVQPRLKVCVDTQPPVVTLRPVQSAAGPAAVEWEVRDDYLDLDTLHLDYRLAGTAEWVPLSLQKAVTGQRAWNPATNSPLEVRLQVKDLAGNAAEATVNVTPGTVPAATGGAPPDTGTGGPRMVNNKRISINYELKDVGKSGIAAIELWYTRTDGRNWQKHDGPASTQSPYIVEVSEEGLYGFTLLARNKAGFGEPPPKVGDPPQIWVEVDLTKPVVRIQNVEVGRGPDLGNLTITYTATDKNLARQAIAFSYAEKPDGPWTSIADKQENTGRFVWRMPETVPYQFYVRVEAGDRAGNVGSADTPKPVLVDLSQPKVQVIGVGVGGNP
jgi:hypothetical protein